MKKFKNKNFRISAPEIIGFILFFGLLIGSAFFGNELSKTQGLLNIGKTKVDFIVQAPSAEQIQEIRNMDSVDKIVPYVYRSVKIRGVKGNINATLFIVENSEDVPYTTFADTLLAGGSKPTAANDICISNELAKNSGVTLGDKISINIDGTDVEFSVCGIYESDYRYVGGSAITLRQGDLAGLLSNARYSGAYVACNNVDNAENYFLNEYVPMGDIRSRDEFDSEDAYQTYLDTRSQSDTTKDTFDTDDYTKEVQNRNGAKITRYMMLTYALLAVAFVIMTFIVIIRASGYTNKNVLRDIKDNYEIEQEASMYGRYFISYALIMIILDIAGACCSLVMGWLPILCLNNIIAVVATILLVAIVGIIQTNKLRQKFAQERKKLKDE